MPPSQVDVFGEDPVGHAPDDDEEDPDGPRFHVENGHRDEGDDKEGVDEEEISQPVWSDVDGAVICTAFLAGPDTNALRSIE